MNQDPPLKKPASGKWTDAYPELGRGPVSLDDCVSQEFYEKEREHIFRKNWLYVGRTERLPKVGSYFTRELEILNTSVLVLRDNDNNVRAFHNICPHRGNKLVWKDDPFQETEGTSPRLYCRFHGWHARVVAVVNQFYLFAQRFNLDATFHFVQMFKASANLF